MPHLSPAWRDHPPQNAVEKLSSLIAFIWLWTRCINMTLIFKTVRGEKCGEMGRKWEKGVGQWRRKGNTRSEELRGELLGWLRRNFPVHFTWQTMMQEIDFQQAQAEVPFNPPSPPKAHTPPLTPAPPTPKLIHPVGTWGAATSDLMMKRCLRQLLFGQSARNR